MEPAERARAFAAARLGAGRLTPLAGDASTRSFWRWRRGRRRAVLMLFPAGDSKQLEATLAVHRLLIRAGLPVPRMLGKDAAAGVLAFQDLGDTTLQHWVRSHGAAAAEQWLERGRRLIHRIQALPAPRIRAALPACPELAPLRFRFELEFFRRHYLAGWLERSVSRGNGARLDHCFDDLCSELARQPRVFCHRDLMSRNLMICRNRLWMLDFQDAQWGPYSYDLASLLFDSSSRQGVSGRAALTARFLGRWNRARQGPGRPRRAFELDLHRAGLQRNLKELGTFAAQALVWGRKGYMRHVPRARRNIVGHLRRLSEGPELASLLHRLGVLDG
ncbi:MAG TPA: phosphotransferase [Acidobacteriota bacterium]